MIGEDKVKNKKYLEMSELPKELQTLEPYEVEDFLCIFKKEFVGN
mgnify:CR=1 FL=1